MWSVQPLKHYHVFVLPCSCRNTATRIAYSGFLSCKTGRKDAAISHTSHKSGMKATWWEVDWGQPEARTDGWNIVFIHCCCLSSQWVDLSPVLTPKYKNHFLTVGSKTRSLSLSLFLPTPSLSVKGLLSLRWSSLNLSDSFLLISTKLN